MGKHKNKTHLMHFSNTSLTNLGLGLSRSTVKQSDLGDKKKKITKELIIFNIKKRINIKQIENMRQEKKREETILGKHLK